MIYIDDHIDDFDLQEALAAVSAQRREQALRYRQERDRRLSVAAYRLLQRALKAEGHHLDGLPQFIHDNRGKPVLEGYPDICFSLSHCREAVACALNDQPVGIDIESIGHYDEEVAVHVMSEKELQEIKASSMPEAAFTRLWTMKESLYKLTGSDNDGDICHMLDKMPPVSFKTIVRPYGVCTICRYKAVTS